MNTIAELIEKAHAMAVEKGWWPDEGRSVVEQVNCFHSEISEAWEEYRHGRMETWYSESQPVRVPGSETTIVKPEGFWVEIADLCIRLADTMGAYEWRVWTDCEGDDVEEIPSFIAYLHWRIRRMGCGSFARTWGIQAPYDAMWAMATCFGVASCHDADLWAIIEQKMAFNATRPVRHGGLKA
jgi:hypothetical protein